MIAHYSQQRWSYQENRNLVQSSRAVCIALCGAESPYTICNFAQIFTGLQISTHKALFHTCSKTQLKYTSNQTWLAIQGLGITDECAGAQKCNSLGQNLGIFYGRHRSNLGFGRNENVM